MNSQNKESKCGDEQPYRNESKQVAEMDNERDRPDSRTKLPWAPAGLEKLIDDLRWAYVATHARQTSADKEELRNMLFEYVENPDVYSDGSRTSWPIGTGYREEVVKPPHRRCGCETCGCKELRRQEEEEEEKAAKRAGVAW